MPLPPLISPDGVNHPLTVAWLSIQTLVRESQPFKDLKVRTYRLGDGEVGELNPPTTAEMPWVRIMPITTPMNIGSESEWECDFRIMYELAVNGTRVADIINLYGAFVTTLSQSTETPLGNVQTYYRSKNIRVVEISQAAIAPMVPAINTNSPGTPAAPTFLYAKGFLHGQVFFPN